MKHAGYKHNGLGTDICFTTNSSFSITYVNTELTAIIHAKIMDAARRLQAQQQQFHSLRTGPYFTTNSFSITYVNMELTAIIHARIMDAARRLQIQQQQFHSLRTGAHFTTKVIV